MQAPKKVLIHFCTRSDKEKIIDETGRKNPEKQGQLRDKRSSIDVTIELCGKERYCKEILSPKVSDVTANLGNFND